MPGYYANQLLDILYLYLPLREIGVRWANHESACHSSRATRRPRLSLLRQNPNSSSLSFSAEWTKIGASKWVLRTLLEGYSLPFSSLPPLTSPVFLASYQNPEKRRALHVAVKEMEMKGAIEVVRTPSPGFYSRLFLVPKARGTWRPIIDLSVVNTHIQCPSFKMETNGSLLKGSIHPSFGQYLRFCHEGVVWQFRALPFWVKHCTTSVHSGHGICRGLRPSQWGQPPRPSRRLAD